MTVDRPVSEITIRAHGTVETSSALDEPSDFTDTLLSPLVFLRSTALTRCDEKLAALAESFRLRIGTLSGLRELAASVHKRYAEGGAADMTHAFIACCRHLGVPARYVSGYVYSPKNGGAARMDMHAWTEAWVTDRWRSFDVAHRLPDRREPYQDCRRRRLPGCMPDPRRAHRRRYRNPFSPSQRGCQPVSFFP